MTLLPAWAPEIARGVMLVAVPARKALVGGCSGKGSLMLKLDAGHKMKEEWSQERSQRKDLVERINLGGFERINLGGFQRTHFYRRTMRAFSENRKSSGSDCLEDCPVQRQRITLRVQNVYSLLTGNLSFLRYLPCFFNDEVDRYMGLVMFPSITGICYGLRDLSASSHERVHGNMHRVVHPWTAI